MSFQIQSEDGSWQEIGAVSGLPVSDILHCGDTGPFRVPFGPWPVSGEFSASEELLQMFRQQARDLRLGNPDGKWVEGPITKIGAVILPDGTAGISVAIDVLRKSGRP